MLLLVQYVLNALLGEFRNQFVIVRVVLGFSTFLFSLFLLLRRATHPLVIVDRFSAHLWLPYISVNLSDNGNTFLGGGNFRRRRSHLGWDVHHDGTVRFGL